MPPLLTEHNEHSSSRALLNQFIVSGLTLLVIAVIFGAFALFHMDRMVEQLELRSFDLRSQIPWGTTKKWPSPDVVILQFDDASLNVLNDEFGVWPWPRDVHARMIHSLNRWGVRSMLYDIMFVAHRKGSEDADQTFINAFRQYNNVYLSMNFDNDLAESQKLGKDLTPKDIEVLEPFSIKLVSELDKALPNSSLKLKKDPDGHIFFDNPHLSFNHYRSIMPSLLSKKSNIGIINHGADEDGVSRSNPLFFRFQYHAFVKTDALPLRHTGDRWYDAEGRRVDKDGYRFQQSEFLPVVRTPNGDYFDSKPESPHFVDAEGYLLDNYRHPVYMRESALRSLFFPYLGLRAVLDLKFRGKDVPMQLTSAGHLQFENYDIPLSANGDFLLNWYNVNVKSEEYRRNLRELASYDSLLQSRVKDLESMLVTMPDNSVERRKIRREVQETRTEILKAHDLHSKIDAALQAGYTPQPYRMISAWEVIRTMHKEEAGLPLNAEDLALKKMLKDKIVFIGATAVAAYDIKNTPILSAMPGVILQANLFDNLYQNDGTYMRRVEPDINFALTLFICLLAAGCTLKMRSALAGLLTAANIAVLYVLLAVLLFQSMSLWINIAMPLVSLITTMTITFMLKYRFRDRDYEKTYVLATTDSMTGLYNHRFFQEHMRRCVDQATRFKHKFSLLLIDIDFFKKFNDAHGHQAGDEVLRHVARKLKKTVRNVDIVARYGGEEMAIILDRASEEEALEVARKIVRAVAEEAYPIAEGVAKHVTISCGVATYPLHGETPSQLIEFADTGLYRAKKNGRNQVGAQQSDTPSTAPEKSVDIKPLHP